MAVSDTSSISKAFSNMTLLSVVFMSITETLAVIIVRPVIPDDKLGLGGSTCPCRLDEQQVDGDGRTCMERYQRITW